MKPQPLTHNHVAVEGRALRAALSPILRVIERRNTYPILGNVRLTYAGSTFTLTGTDLDIMITTTLDVNDGDGGFNICVDPRILSGIARVAGVDLVRIERVERFADGLKPTLQAEARVTIGDDTSYTLPVLDAEAFPSLPGERGGLIERFTNGSLGTMLAKVAPFISNEETRYYLNGVCWEHGPLGKRMMATDGHRLGLCRYAADVDLSRTQMIIPRKTVHLLMALIQGQDVAVYAVAGKEQSQLEIVMGRTTIRTRLIEGTFPDIDRVIPTLDAAPFKLDMNRVEILAALDRVMIMAGRFGVGVRFFREDDLMTLERKNPDQGDATARTNVTMPAGAPDFGLNGTYIRDLIARSQGNVTLHVKDAGAPFRLTDEDETMTRVCMPMRV